MLRCALRRSKSFSRFLFSGEFFAWIADYGQQVRAEIACILHAAACIHIYTVSVVANADDGTCVHSTSYKLSCVHLNGDNKLMTMTMVMIL